MNKKLLCLLITGSTLLSGCLMTRDDIDEQEQKKVVQQQVTNLQKTTADSQSRYTELNEELRDIHGHIDTVENKVQNQDKEYQKSRALRDDQMAESNKKVALLQEEIQKLENQVNFLNQEMVKMSQAQAAVPVAAPVAEKGAKGEKKADNFKGGEDAFEKKDYRNAILQYEAYRKGNPKGKHIGMATFKIGLCFKELGMKDDAKTFFEEVISNNPDSGLAKQAKEQLKKK